MEIVVCVLKTSSDRMVSHVCPRLINLLSATMELVGLIKISAELFGEGIIENLLISVSNNSMC